MNMGERLEQAILRSGLTVNAVAKEANVSAQTLYSIIKRNNKKIDVDILLRILRVLDTSFEYLVEDEIKEEDTLYSLDLLTSTEQTLIKKYRALDTSGKETVDVVMDAQQRRCANACSSPRPNPIEIDLSTVRMRQVGRGDGTFTEITDEDQKRAALKCLTIPKEDLPKLP